MKYKYTRKECNKEIETIKIIFSGSQIMPGGWLETVTQYLHATQLMLLAQKEDKKECICNPFTKTITCPIHGIKSKSIPSPLEIEEIEEIKRMIVYPDICEDLAKVVKEIVENQNTLIRNQKKLYQFIKEKQK